MEYVSSKRMRLLLVHDVCIFVGVPVSRCYCTVLILSLNFIFLSCMLFMCSVFVCVCLYFGTLQFFTTPFWSGYYRDIEKAIDWSELAANNFYFTPARQTRDVGKYIAEMIDYMVKEQGADIRKFHLIGHSLGAHTVGYAGMYTTNGRIPRITGILW